jgi:hypothetical protein
VIIFPKSVDVVDLKENGDYVASTSYFRASVSLLLIVRNGNARRFGMTFIDIKFISSFVKIRLQIHKLKWGENRHRQNGDVINYSLPPVQEEK